MKSNEGFIQACNAQIAVEPERETTSQSSKGGGKPGLFHSTFLRKALISGVHGIVAELHIRK